MLNKNGEAQTSPKTPFVSTNKNKTSHKEVLKFISTHIWQRYHSIQQPIQQRRIPTMNHSFPIQRITLINLFVWNAKKSSRTYIL